MKKIIKVIWFGLLIMQIPLIKSCSQSNTSNSEKLKESEYSAPISSEVDERKENKELVIERSEGQKLIEESDCIACHQEKEKLVGPSYLEIAKHYSKDYENQKTRLISSVSNGGYGQWGEVPMTAHPQHTEEEISLMLDYIMTFAE